MGIEAEAKLQATRSKYAALIEEGRSEAKNLEAFNAKRRHDYEMNKAKVYQDFASRQNNIVLSGKQGDALITQILDLGLKEPAKK